MTTPAQSEAARQLVALVPRATFACANCGREFEARVNRRKDGTGRTCSASCRTTLYTKRKRKRERER